MSVFDPTVDDARYVTRARYDGSQRMLGQVLRELTEAQDLLKQYENSMHVYVLFAQPSEDPSGPSIVLTMQPNMHRTLEFMFDWDKVQRMGGAAFDYFVNEGILFRNRVYEHHYDKDDPVGKEAP